MKEKNILIFKPQIARSLLKYGFPIIDIKPMKEDTNRTIFVFERTKDLIEKMQELIK